MRLVIWSEKENIDQLDWAMQSLKDAMEWDEKTYGQRERERSIPLSRPLSPDPLLPRPPSPLAPLSPDPPLACGTRRLTVRERHARFPHPSPLTLLSTHPPLPLQGREYDLNVYHIVAVNDFNMGAMENKGLNVFNTACVLAKPSTASDADFERVQGVPFSKATPPITSLPYIALPP